MAKKTEKKINKNLLCGICAAIAVLVVAVIVIIVLATGNKPIDESFFKSDDTKYVLTMDPTLLDSETEEYTPEKIHLVYFYSGEKVTGLNMYYEYKDAEIAKKAVDYLKSQENEDEEIKDVSTNGKYVIVAADKSAYENMSADDAKQQVESMRFLQSINIDDYEDDVDTDTDFDIDTDSDPNEDGVEVEETLDVE